MLGLKLNHVSKRGHKSSCKTSDLLISSHWINFNWNISQLVNCHWQDIIFCNFAAIFSKAWCVNVLITAALHMAKIDLLISDNIQCKIVLLNNLVKDRFLLLKKSYFLDVFIYSIGIYSCQFFVSHNICVIKISVVPHSSLMFPPDSLESHATQITRYLLLISAFTCSGSMPS